jgi:hypothetical protein
MRIEIVFFPMAPILQSAAIFGELIPLVLPFWDDPLDATPSRP